MLTEKGNIDTRNLRTINYLKQGVSSTTSKTGSSLESLSINGPNYLDYLHNGLHHAKWSSQTFALSNVLDQPAHSVQANPRQHFMTTNRFCTTKDFCQTENQI